MNGGGDAKMAARPEIRVEIVAVKLYRVWCYYPSRCLQARVLGKPSLDHFWLVYTFQLHPPLGTAKTDESGTSTNANVEILGCKSNSIVSEVLASLNKGMPLPACFNWRGWFRAGLPFFRGDMTLPLPILNNLVTPEAALRGWPEDKMWRPRVLIETRGEIIVGTRVTNYWYGRRQTVGFPHSSMSQADVGRAQYTLLLTRSCTTLQV
ncbi:hypothetical protein J6590_051878 [Homalodisca vitripennis]|nr:hypothetical protein J6590_051878 [Homalodisca vitripennis]